MSAPVAPALDVAGLTKSFGPTRALHRASLTVAHGEVHALLGHNGSGKSTLIKILAGVHHPDGGTVRVAGTPLPPGDGHAAHNAGLRFVHQDLAVVDSLNAVDNIGLGVGFARRKAGTISWPVARARAQAIIAELGHSFDVERPAGTLLPAERTCIAIARALQSQDVPAKVLILDEPTSAMPASEVTKFFAILGALRTRGLGIVFVTHHLDEVREIADQVTVLRDGSNVATVPARELTHAALVELILGSSARAEPAPVQAGDPRSPAPDSTPDLEVAGLRTGLVHGADFSVRRGEIVGIAGLSGSGREEVLPALAGGLPRHGSVRVGGREVPAGRPHRTAALGVGYVPADRVRNGLFPNLTVGSNLTIARLRQFTRAGLLRPSAELTDVRRWLAELQVQPDDPERGVTALSGGNQQKVLVARWLRVAPRVIILDEPSQGVDVGARVGIHWALRRAAEDTAVLIASSDADELATLCDRVIVLSRGRVVGELAGSALTAGEIDARSMTTEPGPQPRAGLGPHDTPART